MALIFVDLRVPEEEGRGGAGWRESTMSNILDFLEPIEETIAICQSHEAPTTTMRRAKQVCKADSAESIAS